MKKIIVFLLLAISTASAVAQISTVSVNKPLAYFNPALQNYETEHGVISASYVVNPFRQEVPDANFLVAGEYLFNENFRAGFHGSKVDSRLNLYNEYKAYMSYRFELEKGNYLILGIDAGSFNDVVKTGEFNKVLSPNVFTYDDSLSKGADLGLGFAYNYNGFTFGLGMSKLNGPDVFEFPEPFFEQVYEYNQDSSAIIDSSFQLANDTFNITTKRKFDIETNINMMYEWEPNDKLKMIHSMQFGNISLESLEFFSFQNMAIINDRHSLGLGVFHNGTTGFNASAGYGITPNIKLEASAFFAQDLNWDATVNDYISNGYKPALEFNARFEF